MRIRWSSVWVWGHFQLIGCNNHLIAQWPFRYLLLWRKIKLSSFEKNKCMPPKKQWIFFWKENSTVIYLLLQKSNFFLAKEDNEFLMSYYFNDLMSYQPKLIDQKMQLMGLILLVFVSKNCQSGPLSSFAQHSSVPV